MSSHTTDGESVTIGELQVHRSSDGVLALEGEIDVSNAPSLPETLSMLGPDEGNMTLDLSRLRFIDSSGVKVLLSLAWTYGDRGNRLVLVSPQGVVERVLKVMQVDRAEQLEIRW